MLYKRLYISQISVLNTAGGVDIPHKCNVLVTVMYKVVGHFVACVKAVADDTAARCKLVIEIKEHHGYLRISDRTDICCGYLTQHDYPVNTLMKKYIGEDNVLLIFGRKSMEKGVVSVLLECF